MASSTSIISRLQDPLRDNLNELPDSDLVEYVEGIDLHSQLFPNEILLTIMAEASQSTLASFARVSLSCLQLASPVLYHHVTISSTQQANLFFLPSPVSLSSLSHLQPYFSRTQTKHLSVLPPLPNTDGISLHNSWSPHHCFIDGDVPLPSFAPLLLHSYFNPCHIGYFQRLINPSLAILDISPSTEPTLLAHVRSSSHLHSLLPPHQWNRLEDFVLRGFLPTSKTVSQEVTRCGKKCRFTLDLSMIEQKVDPMNPRGSCQRLLNEFATLLGGARGRVWVGSREMKQIFEVGREEVRVRLKGSTLGKEVGKIEVEISKLPVTDVLVEP